LIRMKKKKGISSMTEECEVVEYKSGMWAV